MNKFKGFIFFEIIITIVIILMFIPSIYSSFAKTALMHNKTRDIEHLSEIILFSNKEIDKLSYKELPKESDILNYKVIYSKEDEDNYFVLVKIDIKDENDKTKIKYNIIKRKGD